jgi:ariadne-1
MTCKAPCGYQFCWLCRKKWSVHGYTAACNGYDQKKNDDGISDDIKVKSKNLQRYAHYYQRWAANDASFKKASTDLKMVQTQQIEKLCLSQCQPDDRLKFITEAWEQITECRRMLKWSYVYGYYLAEEDIAKKQLFVYSQGEAESALERLHHCAEQEVKEFHDAAESPSPNLNNYRMKLTQLTKVTKSFFENLVTALENGLSDVDPCRVK